MPEDDFEPEVAGDDFEPEYHVTEMPVQKIEGRVPGSAADPRRDPLAALGRAFSQGATARLGDEASSGIAGGMTALERLATRARAALGSDEDIKQAEADAIPRTYAAGSEYADMRDNMRGDLAADKEAYADAPWYADPTVMGEVAGGAILAGAIGGPASPMTVEQLIASSALWGGAVGSGGSTADTLGGVMRDANASAETSAASAPLIALGLNSVGGVAGRAGDWFDDRSLRSRAAAPGMFAHQATALLEEKGDDYLLALGRHAEDLKRKAGGVLPWSPARWRTELKKSAGEYGDAIGQNLDDATAAGVRIKTDPIADRMVEGASGYGGPIGTNVADKQRALVASEADKWRTPKPAPLGNAGKDPYTLEPVYQKRTPRKVLTPQELMTQKQAYEKLAGYKGDRISRLPEGATPEVYQELANPVREALYEGMDTLPEIGPAFRANMEGYGKSNTLLNTADKRVMHDDANQAVSLPATTLASGGLAAAGGPGALAAGTASAAMRHFGKDAIAGMARYGQRAGHAVEDALDFIEPTAVSAGAQARARAPGASPILDASPAHAQDALGWLAQRSTSERVKEATSNGKGHDNGTRVEQVLAANPSVLGAYAEPLAQAQAEGRLAQELFRLDSDPEWRTQVLPQLLMSR